MNTTENSSKYETRECNRCGGSGRYSYCTAYGDRCFGCGGTGRAATARGQRQKAAWDALLSVPASEIAVGDMIWMPKWCTVVGIEPDTLNGEGRIRFLLKNGSSYTTHGASLVKRHPIVNADGPHTVDDTFEALRAMKAAFIAGVK